jgi:predicted nucleic acid-binding protein
MSLFIDTSAILAILDADDQYHHAANQTWQEILSSQEDIVSTNYVLVETFALVQHRFGLEAAKVFQEDIVSVIGVEWVTEPMHQAALALLLSTSKRRLSLVDCVSFVVMNRTGIHKAFTFDHHFREQGFEVVPQA